MSKSRVIESVSCLKLIVDYINIIPSMNILFYQYLKCVFEFIYISCSCTRLKKRPTLNPKSLLYIVYNVLTAIALRNLREHLIYRCKEPLFSIRHKDNSRNIGIVCLLKLL
jgi:hypothetical protein